MSLGAIDFGTIVDGSVVMTENCMHRLETGDANKPLPDIIREAAHEVSRPVIFGVLIIIAVYLPVLTLQSLEGRMFRPMAVTVVSALTGSLLLALFVVPTLCTVALRHRAKSFAGKEKPAKRKSRTGLTVCGMRTAARWAKASATANSSSPCPSSSSSSRWAR